MEDQHADELLSTLSVDENEWENDLRELKELAKTRDDLLPLLEKERELKLLSVSECVSSQGEKQHKEELKQLEENHASSVLKLQTLSNIPLADEVGAAAAVGGVAVGLFNIFGGFFGFGAGARESETRVEKEKREREKIELEKQIEEEERKIENIKRILRERQELDKARKKLRTILRKRKELEKALEKELEREREEFDGSDRDPEDGEQQTKSNVKLYSNIPSEVFVMDAVQLLKKESIYWNRFGRELRVPVNFREELRVESIASTYENKLERVLNKWAESQCSEVSWDSIIKMLNNLELSELAEKVEDYLVNDPDGKKYAWTE